MGGFSFKWENTLKLHLTQRISQSPKCGLTPQECGFGRRADTEPLISHPEGP